jgi:hypothetical protein
MKEMINKSIQDAFTSNDPKMVEMRSQMFRQAGVSLTIVQGQMVPMIGGLPRYPVDDIEKTMACTLLVPYGRGSRKKEVGTGATLPPDEIQEYANQSIPPDYAVVVVSWAAVGFGEHELEFPTRHGVWFLGAAIGEEVL